MYENNVYLQIKRNKYVFVPDKCIFTYICVCVCVCVCVCARARACVRACVWTCRLRAIVGLVCFWSDFNIFSLVYYA